MSNIKDKYDLAIIGAGPAGTPIAIEYAKLNTDKNIALIDHLGELGGECLFQGCIPSKIMEASAKHIKELNSLKEFGIDIGNNHHKLIWDKIKQRKESILSKRTTAAKEIALDVGNIDIIKGFASFEDEKQIKIVLDDKTKKIIEFKKAVIATGSKTNLPTYKGDATDKIITNDKFFQDMELPQDLSIIGSGAIAIEFAQILSTLGVKINLFVRGDKILKNIDNEASEYILNILKKSKNINLLLEANITEINTKSKSLEITYLQKGEIKTLNTTKILGATGRVPNVEKLELQKAGVKFSKRGITTTSSLQTTNKNIFANGDVVENFPKFAHTAQYAAHVVAQNLFLEHNFFKPDFSKNSWVLFSMPNFTQAGITQKEVDKQKTEVIIDRFEFNTEAKSQIEDEDYGYVKFIVEKSSKKIIGISILHEEANTLGGEAALIVANKLTLKDLIGSIHPHPTISESFVMLAKKMMGEIMLKKLKNPIINKLLEIERLL